MPTSPPKADVLSPPTGAEARAADLYERYRPSVYRYCRARLRASDEAEDAVQSTFLRAFTALRAGIVPECESAWLFRIAHNVCLSRRLSSARRARVERPHDLEALGHRLASVEHERPVELGGLREALADMPERLRRVILLRDWQGLSYAEIAEVLETSVSAVETLIFRGRRHLANALAGVEETAPATQLVAA
jgi:RNA polymerase sigma-70 factor, ECF subfamily